MKLGTHKKTFFAILVVTLGTFLSCIRCTNPGSLLKRNGGVDAGGGNVQTSTPDEVRAAIKLAIKLSTETDLRRNIFAQFWLDWSEKSEKEFIKKPTHLFPKVPVQIPPGDDDVSGSGLNDVDYNKFESPYLMALTTNRIILKDQGDCEQSDIKKHADASVSSHTTAAEICFSVGNLSRLSPASLLRDVLSLTLHEVSHIGGADEAEAEEWQKMFGDYFSARFGGLKSAQVLDRTTHSLEEAQGFLWRAQSLLAENPNDPRVYFLIGRFTQELIAIPHFLDPLMLELSLSPARPWLVNNYSNAVLAVIEKATDNFEAELKRFTLRRKKGQRVFQPLPLKNPNEIKKAIAELQAATDIVGRNFRAFVHPSTDDESVCLLPKGVFDQEMFYSHSAVANTDLKQIPPPRKCDTKN